MAAHPDHGVLIAYLDGELNVFAALRIHLHLWCCPGCRRKRRELENQLAILRSEESREELNGIRERLFLAIEKYEAKQARGDVLALTPETLRVLQDYLGAGLAAQLARRQSHEQVDDALRLLLGGKAAARLKTKLTAGVAS